MQRRTLGQAVPIAAVIGRDINPAAGPADRLQITDGSVDSRVTGWVHSYIAINVARSRSHIGPWAGAGELAIETLAGRHPECARGRRSIGFHDCGNHSRRP